MTWFVPHRRGRRTSASPRATGLTLPELLIALAVVALLVTILVPSLGRARDVARSASCRSNLRQLWEILHTPGFSGPAKLPHPDSWVQAAVEQGGTGVLGCPAGRGRSARVLLADVWIEQRHADVVFRYPVTKLLAGRCHATDPVDFFQVHLVRRGADTLEVRIGPSRENFDGGVLIVLGEDTVTFISIDSPNAANCDSNHAVFFGGREVLRLEGVDFPDHHDKVDPWVLTGSTTAYGMNAAVPRCGGRPGQLLLLDYDRQIADPRPEAAAPVTTFLAPRHLGRVNAVHLDGSARAYELDDLHAASGLWHR